MDQDLIAFLENRFQRVDERFDRIDTRLEGVETRLERVEVRLERVEVRLERVEVRLDGVETRLDRVEVRLDGVENRLDRVEETGRHTLVLVEGLRDEVHLLAEGFVGFHERLERIQGEVTLTFDRSIVQIEPYYRDLNQRVRILEGRADRQQSDVLDVVRKILGKPPRQEPLPSLPTLSAE